MKLNTQTAPAAETLFDHHMGRLGIQLLTKAALCALTVGAAAGIFAALFGS